MQAIRTWRAFTSGGNAEGGTSLPTMGYRNDLDAAHARAAMLEQELVAEQRETERLTHEVERLKKPRAQEQTSDLDSSALDSSALGDEAPEVVRRRGPLLRSVVAVALVAGSGLGIYKARACHQAASRADARHEQAQESLIASFSNAWADGRYPEAWELTSDSYKGAVSLERFTLEMQQHPFVQGAKAVTVKPVSKRTVDGRRRAVLHTDSGDFPLTVKMSKSGIESMTTNSFDMLPPQSLSEIVGHRFVRALVDQRFADAWQVTHPVYRKGIGAARFAEDASTNSWLKAATGFMLRRSVSSATNNVLTGTLLIEGGALDLEVRLTGTTTDAWVSEVRIEGRASLPSL